jgi:hypothetical protein
MSSYRYRFVGYEKLPSGLNAEDVQLHCRLPDVAAAAHALISTTLGS